MYYLPVNPRSIALVIAAALLLRPAPLRADPPPSGQWNATGTLLESCTCAVPCTCNFGEGPSPHSYCHAVFAYRLEKASWDGQDLSGLVVAGADGPQGLEGFIDDRATAAQRPALENLAHALFAQGGPNSGPRKFTPAAIVHEVKGNDLRLAIAGYGGFTAHVIVGRDRKSPVVVENNTVWPIPRATKAKATLKFKDTTAGSIQGDGTNSNYGAFSFSGVTDHTDKATSPAAPAVPCCDAGKGH
jgi:hypothetical protein